MPILLMLLLYFSGAVAAEQEQLFPVTEYRVLGNTVLTASEIQNHLYSLLGPDKAIADVEAARQSLETLYHEQGFGTVFVDIPEQSVEDGLVRLRVTEGKLDRVRITGARYFANGRIRAALPALSGKVVPRLPELQSQLTALNSSSRDRSVVPILKAGQTPGTVDVELRVTDNLPLHGSLEINDRFTADTSRWRLNASLSYDNLFQREHSLSLQYQVAPQAREDVEAYVASYVFRVPAWQTTFALYTVDSKTDVAALGTLSVLGTGQVVGLRAIRSLTGSEKTLHSMTFGIDYKDFVEDIQLDLDQGLKTPLRYINWSVVYASTRRGSGELTATGINLGVNIGVRNLVNQQQQFTDKRFRAKPNYVYVRGGVQRTQQLPALFHLFGKISGQLTNEPLVSNEQLALGGADSVRGYLESTQLGDYGTLGTLEIRNSWLATLLKRPPASAYVFGFYDAGVVSIIEPLPGQTNKFELSSAGIGWRLIDWYGIDLAFDWAQPLKASGRIDKGDDRTHLSVRYAF